MSCLLSIREDKKAAGHMSPVCRRQLNDRVEMWENAAKIAAPETFGVRVVYMLCVLHRFLYMEVEVELSSGVV